MLMQETQESQAAPDIFCIMSPVYPQEFWFCLRFLRFSQFYFSTQGGSNEDA